MGYMAILIPLTSFNTISIALRSQLNLHGSKCWYEWTVQSTAHAPISSIAISTCLYFMYNRMDASLFLSLLFKITNTISWENSRGPSCLDIIRPEHLSNFPPVFINTLARSFTLTVGNKVPAQTFSTVILCEEENMRNTCNYGQICLRLVQCCSLVSFWIRLTDH